MAFANNKGSVNSSTVLMYVQTSISNNDILYFFNSLNKIFTKKILHSLDRIYSLKYYIFLHRLSINTYYK